MKTRKDPQDLAYEHNRIIITFFLEVIKDKNMFNHNLREWVSFEL